MSGSRRMPGEAKVSQSLVQDDGEATAAVVPGHQRRRQHRAVDVADEKKHRWDPVRQQAVNGQTETAIGKKRSAQDANRRGFAKPTALPCVDDELPGDCQSATELVEHNHWASCGEEGIK